MRVPTRTDDDIDFLRGVLTPRDPAMPGRSPAASPAAAELSRRRSWTIAGLTAAAAVATILAVTLPLLLTGGSAHAPAYGPSAPMPASRLTTQGSANAPTVASGAKTPTARARYDHVQWRDYQGTRLLGTVDRWWNGVDGRDLHRDATGAVTSDVIMHVASTKSSVVTGPPTAELPTEATQGPSTPSTAQTAGTTRGGTDAASGGADPTAVAGTPAPTSGTDLVADNIPGLLPSTTNGLAKYLADKGFSLTQGAVSIPLQRYLDARQTAALISLARSAATGSQKVTLPTGQPALVLTFARSTTDGGDDTRLVLNASGTRILGTTGGAGGQTWWRLITVSELTATTR